MRRTATRESFRSYIELNATPVYFKYENTIHTHIYINTSCRVTFRQRSEKSVSNTLVGDASSGVVKCAIDECRSQNHRRYNHTYNRIYIYIYFTWYLWVQRVKRINVIARH